MRNSLLFLLVLPLILGAVQNAPENQDSQGTDEESGVISVKAEKTKNFVSSKYNFEVSYPADWEVVTDPDLPVMNIRLKTDLEDYRPNLQIRVERLIVYRNIVKYHNMNLNSFRKNLKDFTFISQGGNRERPGRLQQFFTTYSFRYNGANYRGVWMTYTKNRVYYTLIVTDLDNLFDQHKEAFKVILDSFKIYD